jgi:hypothetical protein
MGAGVKAAEHMIFSSPCETQPWLSEHPYSEYLCFDPAWDKQAALDLIHHFATAFPHCVYTGERQKCSGD